MLKTIELSDGISVQLKSSAALMYIYKNLYNRDILKDFSGLVKNISEDSQVLEDGSTELLTDVAYAMAKLADPNLPDEMTWLDQFETLEFFEKVLPVVAEIWIKENKTTSIPKNR